MPLSKSRDRERKRLTKIRLESPKVRLENAYLTSHRSLYPEGFNSDGTYRKDYNPSLDPCINPSIR